MKFRGLFGKALVGLVVLFGGMTAVLAVVSANNLRNRLTSEYVTKGKTIVQSIASFSDEALVFKVYDSEKDGRARFTPHTSFEDPASPPNAPPRQSIEVRAFAFFTS